MILVAIKSGVANMALLFARWGVDRQPASVADAVPLFHASLQQFRLVIEAYLFNKLICPRPTCPNRAIFHSNAAIVVN